MNRRYTRITGDVDSPTDAVDKTSVNEKNRKLAKDTLWWHFIAFLCHFGVLIFVVIVSFIENQKVWNFSVPVYYTSPTTRPGASNYTIEQKTIGGLQPAVGSMVFEIICIAAHAWIYSYSDDDYYEEICRRRVNPYRWIEYSISASVMLVTVMAMSGVTDLSALINGCAANILMIVCGYWGELNRSPDVMTSTNEELDHSEKSKGYVMGIPQKFLPFIFGSISGIAPWIGMIVSFASSSATPSPPPFVYIAFSTLMFWFFSFALVELNWLGDNFLFCCCMKNSKNKTKAYLQKEWLYIILSFSAKTTLAGSLVIGTLNN